MKKSGFFITSFLLVFTLITPQAFAVYLASDVLGQVDANGNPSFTQTLSRGSDGHGFEGPGFGIAIDTVHHRLFVSDTSQGRIVIFNLSDNDELVDKVPDNVIFQKNLTSNLVDDEYLATESTMSNYSTMAAMTYDGTHDRLFVAAPTMNTVLVFDMSTRQNDPPLAYTLGTVSTTSGRTQSLMKWPRGVAVDPDNNRLYVADSGNGRILIFELNNIANGMNASYVLGAADFTSAGSFDTNASGATFAVPTSAVAYDSVHDRLFAKTTGATISVFNMSGALSNNMSPVNTLGNGTNATTQNQLALSSAGTLEYDPVNDRLFYQESGNLGRVMVFDTASISDGENAVNVLGPSNFTTLSTSIHNQWFVDARFGSMVFNPTNNYLFITETQFQYVKIFDTTPATFVNGMNAVDNIGHTADGTANGTPVYTYTAGTRPNDASATATNFGVDSQADAEVDTVNHRLFVADPAHNRVLVFNLNSNNNLIDHTADYVFGQSSFTGLSGATTSAGMSGPSRLAYDSANNRLFVSDASNNRVLVFNTAEITSGEAAVSILGQSVFTTSTAAHTQAGLSAPRGLAYDPGTQYLYVTSTGSDRITVYDVASITDGEAAINVLGRASFDGGSGGATTSTRVSDPTGVAIDTENDRLFVADTTNNRVLIFDIASLSDGEAAVNVLGQTDFTTATASSTGGQVGFSSPQDVTYNAEDHKLYVSDSNNNRVMIFDVTSITDGENAVALLGQESFSAYYSPSTAANGTFWRVSGVGFDTSNNRLYVQSHQANRMLAFDFVHLGGDLATSTTDKEQYYQDLGLEGHAHGTTTVTALTPLPTGLSMTSSGVITGQTAPGTYTISVSATNTTDYGTFTDTLSYNLEVLRGANVTGSRNEGVGYGSRPRTPETVAVPNTPAIPYVSSFQFIRNLKKGMSGTDVKELQKYLNAHGFTIAVSGAGSAGKETTYFGTATFNAVKKFQEAHKDAILKPYNLTKPTGYVGESTRKFLNSN